MGWCQYYWVYGASSVAIDPSRCQVLLVSQIPTHLQEGFGQNFCFSLTTDVNRVSQNPLVRAVPQNWYNNIKAVRVYFFYFLLSDNYLSPAVNGKRLVW